MRAPDDAPFVTLAQLLREHPAAFAAPPPQNGAASGGSVFGGSRACAKPQAPTDDSAAMAPDSAALPAGGSAVRLATETAALPTDDSAVPGFAERVRPKPRALQPAGEFEPAVGTSAPDAVEDGTFSALQHGGASSFRGAVPAERLKVGVAQAKALRDARLFQAALADAFDVHLARLIREIAADVVGRELLLAPADVAAIARRMLADYAAEEPLRLRVAPGDATIACGLPVVIDGALASGDAILECRTGDIDARLAVRLAAAGAELTR